MNPEEETNETIRSKRTYDIFESDKLTQLNESHHDNLLATFQRRLVRCIFEKSLRSTGYHLTQAALVNNPQLNQTYETYVSKLKAKHDKVFTRYVFYQVDLEQNESQTELNDLIQNGFHSSHTGVAFFKHLDIGLLHEYSKRKPRVFLLLVKVTLFKTDHKLFLKLMNIFPLKRLVSVN